MSLTLTQMPSATLGMLKAAATFTRKPRGAIQLPTLESTLGTLAIDPGHLKAYREICGFADNGKLPITYPQVIAASMHIHLMGQPQFPLPLLGLVHLRNTIVQSQPLSPDERYGVKVAIGEGRQTDKGFDFDLLTTFSNAQGAKVWSAVTTILFRNRRLGGGARKPAPKAETNISEYAAVHAPADIGRRYGTIAGDRNPIHLYAATAKLFGYPRAIAHGMWSLARCAAVAESKLKQPVSELTVQFKQPLLLPGKAAVKVVANDKGADYSLLGEGGKVHLTGFIA